MDRIYISDHPDLPQFLKRISKSCREPSNQSSFRIVSVAVSDWISTLNYGSSMKNPQPDCRWWTHTGTAGKKAVGGLRTGYRRPRLLAKSYPDAGNGWWGWKGGGFSTMWVRSESGFSPPLGVLIPSAQKIGMINATFIYIVLLVKPGRRMPWSRP